jgi:hypothetical protein
MNHNRENSPNPSNGGASPQKFTLPPLNVKTYMNSPMESPRNPGNILGGKFGSTAPLDMSMLSMTTPDLRGNEALAGTL